MAVERYIIDGGPTLCKMLIESVALFHYNRRVSYENVKFYESLDEC